MNKYTWMIVLVVLLLIPTFAFADGEMSGNCGTDATWSYNTATHTLTISGNGMMSSFNNEENSVPWKQYAAEIKTVTIQEGIKGIGSFAFYNCSALESVSFPDSLEAIGSHAFYSCTKLQSITLPKNVNSLDSGAFSDCTSVTTLTFQTTKLKTIPMNTFTSLRITSLSIPEGVEELGSGAFYACWDVENITLPSTLKKIGDNAFAYVSEVDELVIPANVTSVGRGFIAGNSDTPSVVSLTFQGNAPTFNALAFEDINATVYYPCNNTTWTENVRNDYGGSATWKLGHTGKWKQSSAAKCENAEKLTRTCTVCGVTETRTGTAALGHTVTSWNVTTPATPAKKGIETGYCKRCNKPQIRSTEGYEGFETPVLTITKSSGGKPNLEWDKIPYAEGYKICRMVLDSDDVTELEFLPDETSYTDDSARNDEIYLYMMYAYTSTDDADYINYSNESESVGYVGISATTNSKTGSPSLKVKAIEGFPDHELWRSEHKYSGYKMITSTMSAENDFTPTQPGKLYYFKIKFYDGDGFSFWSETKSVRCKCAQPVVTATTDAAMGKPALRWDTVKGAKAYEIYRATSENGTYVRMWTTTATSYKNTSAVPSNRYYYKVKAINASTSKADSVMSAANAVYCRCAQPVVTISTKASTGKPYLTWNSIANAARYDIYRATSKDGTYTKMWSTTATSYTNTSAAVGKTYYYKVVAVHESATDANSVGSEAKVIVCDCAHPVVSIKRNSKGQPQLTWSAVEGAKSYEVYRATSKNGTYTKMYTTSATSYINTSAKAGTTYYYKVRALCARSTYGNSAYSAVKSITAR